MNLFRNRKVTSFISIAITFLFPLSVAADGPWNDKAAAVVLTYDDALNVHLDTVIPLLNENNMRGTFYLTGFAKTVSDRADDWRSAAIDGHELGNHTMRHPCSGGLPGREWVREDRDLDKYSVKKYADEIAAANKVLHSIDGKDQRSFAYTCGDKEAGGESIVEVIRSSAVAARGVNRGINSLQNIQLFDLLAYSVSGQRAEELVSQVDDAIKNNGLLIFLFHGVGGEHGLNIEKSEHQKFIQSLVERKKHIWVAPLDEVADYLVTNGLVN